MTSYQFEVVATYSTLITVEADSPERAEDLAISEAPNWISIGREMAYADSVDVYPRGDA